jgi:hypothetical protein
LALLQVVVEVWKARDLVPEWMPVLEQVPVLATQMTQVQESATEWPLVPDKLLMWRASQLLESLQVPELALGRLAGLPLQEVQVLAQAPILEQVPIPKQLLAQVLTRVLILGQVLIPAQVPLPGNLLLRQLALG